MKNLSIIIAIIGLGYLGCKLIEDSEFIATSIIISNIVWLGFKK